MTIARILIVAGSDSGGGAGLQADIKTVSALGGHAMTAITAITAQNTLGVQAVHPVPTGMVLAQMESVIADIGVDAVKIGMIGSAETAQAVAARLVKLGGGVPIVFDPVMVATSGSVLADAATIAAFEALMRIATVTTPNLDELIKLAGRSPKSEEEIEEAAVALQSHGCALLVTGLKLGGEEISNKGRRSLDNDMFDMLCWENPNKDWKSNIWHDPRIATEEDHGTGCTLASAIATGLGQGMTLPDAIARARRFVRAALEHAPGLGQGHGPMGQQLVDGAAL